jgi:hypothetical protein
MPLRFAAKSKKRGNEDLQIVIRSQNSRNDGCFRPENKRRWNARKDSSEVSRTVAEFATSVAERSRYSPFHHFAFCFVESHTNDDNSSRMIKSKIYYISFKTSIVSMPLK